MSSHPLVGRGTTGEQSLPRPSPCTSPSRSKVRKWENRLPPPEKQKLHTSAPPPGPALCSRHCSPHPWDSPGPHRHLNRPSGCISPNDNQKDGSASGLVNADQTKYTGFLASLYDYCYCGTRASQSSHIIVVPLDIAHLATGSRHRHTPHDLHARTAISSSQ